jgi:hypothetical protein
MKLGQMVLLCSAILFPWMYQINGQDFDPHTNTHRIIFEDGNICKIPPPNWRLISEEQKELRKPTSTQAPAPVPNLTLTANFKIAYAWIYNELGYDLFEVIDDDYYSIAIPDGKEYVRAGYAPS